MTKMWPENEERAFRGAPHRWTFNERLMVDEIDALRAVLRKILPGTTALLATHNDKIAKVVVDDIRKTIEDAKMLIG